MSTTASSHPAGLAPLFLTEMWERFSYYGMRAILVLYMVAPVADGGLGWGTAQATHLYGTYTGSVYLSTIVGGLLADRWLGARLAVLIGGIIIAMGHFSLALASLPSFYAGLVFIVLGTGLLKPNISTMVGSLYKEGDARRDAGFSIFYMGINLGAFIAPLICGYLAQRVSWHYGFAAAGVGMVLGLAQFLVQRKLLAHVGGRPGKGKNRVAREPFFPIRPSEWRNLIAIFVLFVFSAVFWMAFEQAGSSLNLFALQKTDTSLFGYDFPSSWLQSVNSLFIILLAPVMSALWLRMGKKQPSSPAKFSLGLLFAGLGFLLLCIPSSMLDRVSPMWLVGVYFLHSIGELCLSPVGLSTVTQLAPSRMVGLMMGVFFLSLSLGNYAAGWVAGFYGDGTGLVPMFLSVAAITIVAAGILALLVPKLRMR
jgi:proton-dependent oligopeptide transporter, POT family